MHWYHNYNHILDRWLLNQRTSCPVCGLAAFCAVDDEPDSNMEVKFVAKSYETVKSLKKIKPKPQIPHQDIIEIIGIGRNEKSNDSNLSSFSSSSFPGKRHKRPIKDSCSKNLKNEPLESFLFVQSISAIQTFSSSIISKRNTDAKLLP